jgi:hypothetical protein
MSDAARFGVYAVGLLIGIASVGGNVLAAGAVSAPEIDGGSLATGLGVVTAAALILRSRRRSR